jgi:uncharacterized membrane protein
MWEKLGKYFLNGLMALLPVFITAWLSWLLFIFADGFLGGIISTTTGFYFPGLGILAALLLILFAGFLTTYVFGKRLLRQGERILYKLPFVNAIYSSTKQVNKILFLQKETKAFRRACAVQYPRKGIYSIGFVTGPGIPEIKKRNKREYLNVFIPNTPTPATGFMIVVPASEVIMLDMPLEDALKLVVSGGVLAAVKRVRKR